MTLLKNCTEKAFELVIDLTHATSLNEPDVSIRRSNSILLGSSFYVVYSRYGVEVQRMLHSISHLLLYPSTLATSQ